MLFVKNITIKTYIIKTFAKEVEPSLWEQLNEQVLGRIFGL